MNNEDADPLKRPLAGMRVLITRPEPQAQVLAQRLEDDGACVTCLPVIVIEDVPDPAPALQLIRQLSEFYAAVFVSINAVERGIAMVRQCGEWPPAVHCGAVGDTPSPLPNPTLTHSVLSVSGMVGGPKGVGIVCVMQKV